MKEIWWFSALETSNTGRIKAVRGIGRVKALEIKALIELGRRIQVDQLRQNNDCPCESYELAKELILQLKDQKQEHLVASILIQKSNLTKETLVHRVTGSDDRAST